MTTPQWKLRRLSTRAERVLERRGGESPALVVFRETLAPKARRFITAYDSVQRFGAEWRREMQEGRGAVADLVSAIRVWLPRIAADVPGFDRSTFADTAVPDDVMEDANRLIETAQDRDEAGGAARLIYGADLIEQVSAALAKAGKEWHEAEVADRKYQAALSETRVAAREFEVELQIFRETLSQVTGRNDVDYQKLRTRRAATTDPEDDPTAPAPLGSSTSP